MNVFEDLVIELQHENLLESTVIEPARTLAPDDGLRPLKSETHSRNLDPGAKLAYLEPAPGIVASQAEETEAEIHEATIPESAGRAAEDDRGTEAARITANSEFFKKKAVAEVSALQMVEHVLTGIEREYIKVVPNAFDDFNAKKALNTFLNADDAADSEAHATAEYNLMHETEAWCSALAVRDQAIPVSALRQYCERSRPALSSQALLGLGRFYRNLPYSENVRSKFDFVVTRLFSRTVDQENRVCLFTRDETLKHINTLYSDWSSVPLYAVDEDDSKVMLTALSFEDIAIAAENASSFDQLIESDFFGRLRMFKESIAELFYAPQVTTAAIDANIRIGNAYVSLIDRERQKLDVDSLCLKYGEHDVAVSETIGKTHELSELLRQLGAIVPDTPAEPRVESIKPRAEPSVPADTNQTPTAATNKDSSAARIRSRLADVNKWFLIVAAFMIAASVGLYVWANYAVEVDRLTTDGVKNFDIAATVHADHVKTVRISGDMFYAQMTQSWEALPREKRLEILERIYQTAVESGCSQVTLIAPSGKNAGYASANRTDVAMY
jgi:hypothetical protein